MKPSDFEDCALYISIRKTDFAVDLDIVEKMLSISDLFDLSISPAKTFFNGMEKFDAKTSFEYDVEVDRVMKRISRDKLIAADLLEWSKDELLTELADTIEDLSVEHEELKVEGASFFIGQHEVLELESKNIITSPFSIAFHCNAPATNNTSRISTALYSDEEVAKKIEMLEDLLGADLQVFCGAC